MIVLASGGLDSTLVSVLAAEAGVVIYPLFIDYGQAAAKREWDTCRRMLAAHRLPAPVRMDVAGYGRLVPSGLTDPARHILIDAFLPGRNSVLLTLAASYATALEIGAVAIGLADEGAHLFPDQTASFLLRTEDYLTTVLPRRIRLTAPLLGLTKREIATLALARGIDGTYSCHAGGAAPCGKCISCRERLNSGLEA